MNTVTDHENFRAELISAKHTQVAAIFNSQQEASNSASELTKNTAVKASQITLVDPNDNKLSQKLEGPSKPIGKSMWHSHLALGGAGLVAGLIAAFFLTQFGPALTQQNPLFTYIALISPGLFIGLFIAGLIGLRPDRTEIINTVRHAVKERRYALIINLKDSQSVKTVTEALSKSSNKVVEAVK
ncbi:hypothetical protein [Alteromonas antoniana]|uniref:hypothetical protein n=1 Tax=Alteromonas antoniana TaxID=2803813 RepID=UPI001C47AAEF|nr:hypothetical protein [Alteromonas antoniana]